MRERRRILPDYHFGSPRDLAVFTPPPGTEFGLEAAARLAQVSRHRLMVYCKRGFIAPRVGETELAGWVFDAAAIRTVRRLEFFRLHYGVNDDGLRMLLTLLREVDELRRELQRLHEL